MKNEQKFRNNMRFSMGFFVTLFIVLMVYMGYSVIKNGRVLTCDLGGNASTTEFTEEIIKNI